jgi:hypothetical protein
MVLLKNEGHALPLSKSLKTLAVIGPNADELDVLVGNYNGEPSAPITPLAGIRSKLGASTRVIYARGSDVAANPTSSPSRPRPSSPPPTATPRTASKPSISTPPTSTATRIVRAS